MAGDHSRQIYQEFLHNPKYIELSNLVQQTVRDYKKEHNLSYSDIAELCHEDLGLAVSTTSNYISDICRGISIGVLPPIDEYTPLRPNALPRLALLAKLSLVFNALELAPHHNTIEALREVYGEDFVYPPGAEPEFNYHGELPKEIVEELSKVALVIRDELQTILITPIAKYTFLSGKLSYIEPVENYKSTVAEEFNERRDRASLGAFSSDYTIQTFGAISNPNKR